MSGGTTHEAVADLHKALLAEQESKESRASKSLPPPRQADSEWAKLATPGGFRRNHLHEKADEAGVPHERRPANWNRSFIQSVKPLIRIGYFDSVLGIRFDEDGEELPPLQGECGVAQTALAILKSFIGSGITFLPGAFKNGGWLFSSVVLIIVGVLNAVCIHLLLECSKATGLQSMGDIAERASGPKARTAVHVSLVISQFGTNIAFMIFITRMAVSLGATAFLTLPQITMVLVLVIAPLCFMRSVHKMEYAILGADAFIIFGLFVVMYFATETIQANGAAPDVEAFQPLTCGLFMGTAIFTFEGIPFILPLRSSMQEPEKFYPLFLVLFPCIVFFFAGFGLLAYSSYGALVDPVVLMNLPSDQPISRAVRFLYMLALTLSSPLTFLPGARITELWVFGIVPKGTKKWSKNLLRTLEVAIFGVIAFYGGKYFDKFLAFVGALCCAPIAFVYPAYYHLMICGDSLCAKLVDVSMILLGFAALFFVLNQALHS